MRLDVAQDQYDEAVEKLRWAEDSGASKGEVRRRERIADQKLRQLRRLERAEGYATGRRRAW